MLTSTLMLLACLMGASGVALAAAAAHGAPGVGLDSAAYLLLILLPPSQLRQSPNLLLQGGRRCFGF